MKKLLVASLLILLAAACAKKGQGQGPSLREVVQNYNGLVEQDTVGKLIRIALPLVPEADRLEFHCRADQTRLALHAGLTTLVEIHNASRAAESGDWDQALTQIRTAVTQLINLADALEAFEDDNQKAQIEVAAQILLLLVDQIPRAQTDANHDPVILPLKPNTQGNCLGKAGILNAQIIGVLK